MINTNIMYIVEVGTSSTVEGSILEPPLSDSEDPHPSSPPCDSDDEHGTPSPKRPAVDDASASLTDVAQVIGSRNVSASTRYSLLTNHFRPSVDYKFPKGASGRSFQPQWLQSFPWLVYSKQADGGFCLPCVLFASVGYRGSSPGVLVSRPLTVFKKALETLRKHADKEHHKSAIVGAEEFKKTMSNQQPTIQQRLSKSLADRIAMNRKKLESIMNTIILCGRQNIPLRGHRDSATDIERDVAGIANHGNFVALLNFRIESGDTVIREHLSTAARNATYTSNTVQNQIITVLADQVTTSIIDKVKAAKWFTVIADEVTDVANREQLSIVLRYVDIATLTVREDLVGFFECDTGISGRSLSEKIKSTLTELGLDLSCLRGQAYDGAGNMAGSVNGAAALIRAEYPLAIYLHCASHCLNLAVVKSLEVTSVRNMMGVIGKVYQFFDVHPKRQRAFEKSIVECQPSTTSQKLKDLCRTRWIQRIDAIDVFKRLFPSIVDCLENICSDGARLWSADSLTDARGLQLAITTTEFVSALVVTNSCFSFIESLTLSLQAEAKDIVQAVREIDTVIATLQDVRDNIDTYHSEWFLTISEMLSQVCVEPSVPRRCGRQIHRRLLQAHHFHPHGRPPSLGVAIPI